MKAPLSDISKALVVELNALRERHHQFRARVKAADKAARERDEEAQRQNDILTQRIVGLETELKEGREAIEALRQFVELLPTAKAEFDSFEDDIESFEGLGDSTSSLERITSAAAKVDALEQGIRSITGLRTSSVISLSDTLHDGLAARSVNPISGKYSATTSGTCTPTETSPRIPYAELQTLDPYPDPPALRSQPDTSVPQPPQPTLTNRERLELITELAKQPLKNGDLWFIIPQLWFDDWKKMCEEKPDDVETQFSPISTSILIGRNGALVNNKTFNEILYTERAAPYDRPTHGHYYRQSICANVGRKTIPSSAWHKMLDWYRCDSVQFPRLVTPKGPERSPSIDEFPHVHNLYFLLPAASSNVHTGPYTPKMIIPRHTLVKTVRSMVFCTLPSYYPRNHSIEFFSTHLPRPSPKGWYISELPLESDRRAILLDWQSDHPFGQLDGSDIIVSIKMLDEAKGCMVNIDPFPPPALSPPKILAWNYLDL